MSFQRNFLDEWDAAEKAKEVANRQREMAHAIIDESPADYRVKALLHMLTDWPQAVKDERGNWIITASQPALCGRLARSRNCLKSYIKLALLTPYFEVLQRGGDEDTGTYVIHWRSILDRETTQPDATSTAQRSDTGHQDATSTDGIGSDEEYTVDQGGHNLPPGGVNPDEGGGHFDPVNSDFDRVNPASSEERLSDVLKAQVQSTSEDVLEVLVGIGGDQSRRKAKPMKPKFWRQWEEAVRLSDLGNPQHVQGLYEMLTSMVVIKRCDVNRHRVFATAAMNERKWKSREALTRKGLFLTNVARELWYFDPIDELIATRMIHELDHPSGPSATSRAAQQVARERPLPIAKEEAPPLKTARLAQDLAESWGLVGGRK